ncbi:MAG: M10 family metallopeptidase [Pseudomonadota bacterium]
MPLNSIELRARIDSVLLADDFGISQWYGTGTSPLRLTYRFPTEKAPDSDFGYFGGLFAFNAAEKAAFRRAFDIFENVLNVEFVEDNFSYDVNFNFFRVGDLLPLDPSSTGIAAARWWHDRNGWDGDSFYQRGYDWSDPRLFHVILHEIGHMFGLKHPGPYDAGGNIPPGPYLPANEDNDRYTVMSYTTNSETGIPSTSLMLYDIAALQKFWGANMSPKTNVDEYTFSKNGPIQTIWDTQGIDTINHIVGPASVDLRPGGWSSLSGVERLAIAYGTTIENARTGSFADEVQGNSAHNRIDLGG